MKNVRNSILAILVTGFALAATGCARGYTGIYNFTSTLNGGQMGLSCPSATFSMNLVQNGANVTGQTSSNCFTATMTGTDAGFGQMNNVVFTLTPLAMQGGFVGNGNCVYAGNLTTVGDTVQGNLLLQAPAAQQGQPQQFQNTPCANAISLSGKIAH